MTTERVPAHYHDTGCEVAPRCTACPLPACRYEVHLTSQRAARRIAAVAAMRDMGWHPTEIASALGIGVRTVFRLHTIARLSGRGTNETPGRASPGELPSSRPAPAQATVNQAKKKALA